jgi:ubiquinone/menaquinone biosynthesis C-methylase UbiE
MPTTNQPTPDSDVWSEWLLHRRHGGDNEYNEHVQTVVDRYAKRVLDGAKLQPGMTLVDIGSGEGLVPFRAIEEVGPTLKVVITDISGPMLRYAERVAEQKGVRAQCTFIECPADNLESIANHSADVVTTRAVLAYVADKKTALKEFFRILKPSGRISLAEPIFQDESFSARVMRNQLDAQGPQPGDMLLRLYHRWKAAQYPDTEEAFAKSPIVNFSERDLVSMVQNAGFGEIHMEFHIEVKHSDVVSWETFIETSPHPWAPPLSAIMAEQFSQEERVFFESVVRPQVEGGVTTITDRSAYLTAIRPSV